KKDKKQVGVFVADEPSKIETLLASTPVGDIWGIGRQHQKLLEENGFTTAKDLVVAPEDWIRKQMTVVGQRMLFELKGIKAIEWEDRPPPKKNICTARSFGTLLSNLKDISQAV